MLASQYMFTACGKRKNGDFIVWSKSADVTDAEGEEIHQLMVYKNPSGVNLYDSSEEEIKAACPTKYAYFELSTGKKVLAESNFIGRVYSDADNRWGNFFIHAYVFDSAKDLLPMAFLCKNKFKCKLEYREWHDEPCPETLPQVDIQPAQLNLQELNEFLTPERKRLLLPLLQSAIQAAEGGATVSFNDTEENQVKWYTLVGLLVPASVREKVTFASQMIPLFTSASSIPGRQSAKLAMRNIANGVSTTAFNYATNASMKQPVFDFRNNIYVEVALNSYVTELGNALNKSLMSALEYVKDVESLCNSYGCTTEQAVALYMLKYNKMQWFADFNTFTSTIETAEKLGMITSLNAVELIYRAIFVNKQWQEKLSIQLVKKIYDSIDDKGVRDNLIAYYLANLNIYGVRSSEASAYVNEFYGSAPFNKKEFIQYLYSKNFVSQGFAQANDFCKNYLVFKTFLGEYYSVKEDVTYPIFTELFELYINRHAYSEFDLMLSDVYSINSELAERLVRDMAKKIDPVRCNDILFHLVEVVRGGALQLELLKMILAANLSSSSFIDTYCKYFNKNSIYSRLENELVRDPKFSNIAVMRETYAFFVNNNITRDDLKNYFKKYYLTNNDNGLYLTKLKRYISLKGEVKYAFEIYSDISSVDVNFADMKEVLLCLQTKMYDNPVSELLKYDRKEMAMLDDIDKKLVSCGCKLPQNSNYMKFIRDLLSASKENSIAATRLMEYFHKNNIFKSFTEVQREQLVQEYLGELFEVYLNYRTMQINKRQNDNFDYNANVLSNLLYQLLLTKGIFDKFTKVVAKMNAKNYILLLSDLFIFATNYNGYCPEELKVFLEQYLKKIGNRKRIEKLMTDILEIAPETFKAQIKAYIESINESINPPKKAKGNDGEKKSGFFSFLFRSKKKNDDDDDNK